MDNISKVAKALQSIDLYITQENDKAHQTRLDRLQAELQELMAQDLDGVIERVVKARNAALAERYAA